MSKPLVTFGDPERLAIAYLTTQFAARAEAYKPATITTAFPTTALTGDTTHAQVELEIGDAADYPVTERARVRFTCYAAPGERTNVKALASLTQALMSTHPGDASVTGCFIRVGRSAVVTDPATKNLMVWFIAQMNLSATSLAS